MNQTLSPLTAALIVRWFNLASMLGISMVLLIAFFYQFAMGELPCPLCLLQRVAFIMVGIGFLMNIRFGSQFMHYGLIIISALGGALSSGRQVLLHIIPGTDAYGSALFGLHFYTWSFISFMIILLAVGLIFMVENRVGEARSETAGGRLGLWVGALLLAIVFVNMTSTFLECGTGACADNPMVYQLLVGLF